MTIKLTPEQSQALEHVDGPVSVEDDQRRRTFVLVDEPTFLALQQQSDLAAIREGVADMHAGRVAPLDEAVRRIRSALGLSG